MKEEEVDGMTDVRVESVMEVDWSRESGGRLK
jgi:hypothetical protein